MVNQLCRFCFTFGQSHIQIFKESIKIVETIQQIFHCEVSEFDLLPNSVCVDCWITTETFHKFFQQVKAAQNQWLLQAIVKTEMESDELRSEHERNKITSNQVVEGSVIHNNSPSVDNMLMCANTSENDIAAKKLDPLNEVENMGGNDFNDLDKSYTDDDDLKASSTESQSSEAESSECESMEENSENNSSSGKTRDRQVKIQSKHGTKTRKNHCEECGKYFYRADRLRMHKKLKHSFNCHVCNIGVATEQKLMGHLKTHDKDFDKILKEKINAVDLMDTRNVSETDKNEIISKYFNMECDVCKIHLESLQQAKSHYMSEHNTLGYIRCCNLIIRHDHQIREHVLLHLNPEIFRCSICYDTMKTKSHLKIHLKSHAVDEHIMLSCPICHQKYSNQNSLGLHMARAHSAPDETFNCDFCDKSYLDREQFEKHLRTKHETALFSNAENDKLLEVFDMTCDICVARFESFQQAKAHYWNDHNDPNGYIKCCDTKIKTIGVVKEHIIWHFNPDVFKCNVCGKTHKFKDNLISHLAGHKSKGAYVCDECGEVFSRKDALKTHKERHGSECNFCLKTFLSKPRLEAHLKTHDEDVQEKIIKAIEAVNQIDTVNVTASQIQNLIATDFDMTCDLCKVTLESLEHAKVHYLNDHNSARGYIKCCGLKLRDENAIREHIVCHYKPELFRCFICNETLKIKIHLKTHLQNHANENQRRRYACDICSKNFSHKLALSGHIVVIHTKPENQFKCKFCDKLYLRENQLDRHMRRMHEIMSTEKCEIMAKYFDMSCDECGIHLDSLIQAQQHYLNEHNNSNGYIKCCDMKFKSLVLIEDHIEWHKNPGKIKCNICDKEFKLSRNLRAHISSQHTQKHPCDLCEKVFKSRRSLRSHHQSRHQKQDRPFSCRFCVLRFVTEETLHTHEQVIHYRSTIDAQTMCEICGKGFIQDSHLRKHMKNNHSDGKPMKVPAAEEREMCTICGLWLPNRYRLKIHRKLHKAVPNKCDHCGLEAPNQEALLCHIRAFHKDRRKFKCRLCDQSFSNAMELQEHAPSHAGEKLYHCNYCSDAFIWRASLTAHKKKSHPTEFDEERSKRVTKVK